MVLRKDSGFPSGLNEKFARLQNSDDSVTLSGSEFWVIEFSLYFTERAEAPIVLLSSSLEFVDKRIWSM